MITPENNKILDPNVDTGSDLTDVTNAQTKDILNMISVLNSINSELVDAQGASVLQDLISKVSVLESLSGSDITFSDSTPTSAPLPPFYFDTNTNALKVLNKTDSQYYDAFGHVGSVPNHLNDQQTTPVAIPVNASCFIPNPTMGFGELRLIHSFDRPVKSHVTDLDKVYAILDDGSYNELVVYDMTQETTRTIVRFLPDLKDFKMVMDAVGDKIYLLGGKDNNQDVTDKIIKIDLVLETFEELASTMPFLIEMDDITSSPIARKSFIVGGRVNGQISDMILEFDWDTEVVTHVGTLPTPLFMAGVHMDETNQKIIIFGGFKNLGPNNTYMSKTLLEFEINSNTISNTRHLNKNYAGQKIVVNRAGNMVAYGGYVEGANGFFKTNDKILKIDDPATDNIITMNKVMELSNDYMVHYSETCAQTTYVEAKNLYLIGSQ